MSNGHLHISKSSNGIVISNHDNISIFFVSPWKYIVSLFKLQIRNLSHFVFFDGYNQSGKFRHISKIPILMPENTDVWFWNWG
jgi:hypothetical protein